MVWKQLIIWVLHCLTNFTIMIRKKTLHFSDTSINCKYSLTPAVSKGFVRFSVASVYENCCDYPSFIQGHSAVCRNISLEKMNRPIPILAKQV